MSSCANTENKEEAATTEAPATVAEAPAATPPPKVDSATAMQNWIDYATPGEIHKMLATREGKWATETQSWVAEGAPPQTSKGEAQFKMVMGGRYLQSMYKGDLMGLPFEGMGMTAYDNSKKMIVESWVDNMGTGLMTLEGSYDAATKTQETKGKMIDPSTNTECMTRNVVKYTDDTHMTMEMYVTPMGGKEMKNMEIKYTKK